jgi:hypothetical protein
MSKDGVLENFIQAFGTHGSCNRAKCDCGQEFYNPAGDWAAKPLDYAVGTLEFDGHVYCVDCTCWHLPALKHISCINAHAQAIVDFLRLEKARKQREADLSPVLEEAKP